MRHLLAAILLFAVGLAAQAAPALDPVAGGTCLLAGGGKLPPAIFARFLELAGGEHAKVVLIPTASETADDAQANDATVQLFRERLPGAEVTLLHTRDRALADDEAFCTPLLRATGVWLGGGAQDRLASAYLGTRVERELLALLARGGVVAGTSAGTAIQTRTMIQEGMDPPVMAQGFDFVPGAISDQHFLKRKRLPRLLRALSMHPGLFGIGVDEGTAAVIHGDQLDVIGASKVVLVLPATNGHDEVTAEFAAQDPSVAMGAWRLAARARASWQLPAGFAQPRLEAGTLVLGTSTAALDAFVRLAGDKRGKIVLIPGGKRCGQDVLFGNDHSPEGRLAAIGCEVRSIDVPLDGTIDEQQLAPLADATGVIIDPGVEHWTAAALDTEPVRQALRGVLARGGVIASSALLGELVIGFPGYREPTPRVDVAYHRGLGLLPGCNIGLLDGTNATPSRVEAGLREWSRRRPMLGLAVQGAAIVRGSELEVPESSRVGVFAALTAAKPDTAEPIWLEPGTRYDLVTGALR